MKTLGKLKINPENVLKVDELKYLKGGDIMCYVIYDLELVNDFPCEVGSLEDCNEACDYIYDNYPGYECTCY